LLVVVAGCGGSDDGDSGGDSITTPTQLDNELLQLARTDLSLIGDPAASRSLLQTRPAEDDLVKLGQILFFSKTPSGGFDVACASCHHPDFAGGDSLSLSVGVNAQEPSTLGPGRVLDANEPDLDPLADGGPNVPRNSQTVFNTALYSRALFHDGRVFVLDDEMVPQGEGQRLKTPEGGNVADPVAGDTLLAAQAKLPMPSDSEMRGFLYTNYSTPVEYREHLIRRLQGLGDRDCCFDDPDAAAANWLDLFREAYDAPAGTAAELITQAHVQGAIAAYEASLIFVNTPWKRYLAGDYGALSKGRQAGRQTILAESRRGRPGLRELPLGGSLHRRGLPQRRFPPDRTRQADRP
jgi:cytochrome c peroxidase